MFKFLKSKKVEIIAPMTGEVVEISQVPDPVFAEKMIGDGLAIEPKDGLVVAPCNGKVVQIFPTNHAIGIETKEGFDLLIHLGIDTVELGGRGFERLIEEGQEVTVGTPLLKMDIDRVIEDGKKAITPVIITTMDQIQKIDVIKGPVTAGKNVIMEIKIK